MRQEGFLFITVGILVCSEYRMNGLGFDIDLSGAVAGIDLASFACLYSYSAEGG